MMYDMVTLSLIHVIRCMYTVRFYIIMILLILTACIVYRILRSLFFVSNNFDTWFKGDENYGLVIAHPDDETMFFSPWIRTFLRRRRSNVEGLFVLCLSNGNGDGLGKVREKEILEASVCLGMRKENIKVIQDSRLPDGLKNVWKTEAIREHVLKFVKSNKISTLLTFDDFGVSGHINHIGCSQGVQETAPDNVAVWILRSTQSNSNSLLGYIFGLVHKYMGPLGIVLDDLLSCFESSKPVKINVTNFEPRVIWNAMASHQSQFVWYRRLFIIFSHFVYSNTLVLHSNNS